MRIDQLTFTRFLAAIAIVIFHYGRETAIFNNSFLNPFLSQANIGVNFFFVLSGFVMMVAYGNLKKVGATQFYRNRIARIYPLYLVALLLIVIERLVVNIPVSSTEFLLNMFAFQSLVPSYSTSMNFPGWTLSVEFFFYAFFPFLVNTVYKNSSLRKLLVFTGVIWLISQTIYYFSVLYYQAKPDVTSYDLVHHFPLMHINQFLIGNIAGLVFFRLKDIKTILSKDIFIVLLTAVLFLLLKYPLPIGYHNGFLTIIFAPLIISLSLNKGIIQKVFSLKILQTLGILSYGIYILQYPVHMYTSILFNKLGLTFNFYAYLVILVIVSYFANRFVEVPLKNLISHFRLKNQTSYSLNKPIVAD